MRNYDKLLVQYNALSDLYDRQVKDYEDLEILYDRQSRLLEMQSAMLVGIVKGLGFDVDIDNLEMGSD